MRRWEGDPGFCSKEILKVLQEEGDEPKEEPVKAGPVGTAIAKLTGQRLPCKQNRLTG